MARTIQTKRPVRGRNTRVSQVPANTKPQRGRVGKRKTQNKQVNKIQKPKKVPVDETASKTIKRRKTPSTVADKSRYVADYYHKCDKNKAYVDTDEEILKENRVLGKSAKLALLRRNGIALHTKNCNLLLHRESDRYLKKLAKEVVRSMHLFIMNKRHRLEDCFRIMPKHVRNGLELMNHQCLV
jgi:hypothetical protein